MTTTNDYLTRTENGTAFVGSDVNIFAGAVIASGLRLYAKTKLIPNRAYTPTAMLKAASRYTGKTYKRGQYLQAADDLTAMVNELKMKPRTP